MKKIGLMALLLTLAAVVPVQAEQWSKTYQISGAPDLRVETSDANIQVDTWEQKTIEATITSTHYKIGPGGLQLEEHQSGDTVEINLRFPHHFQIGKVNNSHVDIMIHMPRKGRVALHTGDGNIQLAGFSGEMDLSSGDGNEELRQLDGRLQARTGDGHIDVDGRFDALTLKSGDGHIQVRAASGSTLAQEWEIRTGDGNVSVEVPENLAADLHLHTGDGRIDVNLPMTTDGRFRDNDVRGKLNGGGNLISIDTGDGSISVGKG